MPHVEVIVAAIQVEIGRVLRGVGLIGSAGIADAVRPGPLRPESQPGTETPVQRSLQRIVMIRSAARLEIDLRKPIAELHHRYCRASSGIHAHTHDPIGPSAQEQVAALAADIGHCQQRFAG